MKVSAADFKNAVTMFEASIIEQTNDLTNKSALAMAFTKYAPKIDAAIVDMAKDGMVDVDEFRALVDAGLKGGGGQIVLKPEIPTLARLIGVTIKDITITAAEAEEFFTKTIPQVSPSLIQ